MLLIALPPAVWTEAPQADPAFGSSVVEVKLP
jgi:hypothetical protein